MDLRDYKPGDKFITRSGQTVTLQAFHPDKSAFYQVRFTREPTWNSHKLYFYTSLSGREVDVFESAEDIIKPAPVEYKFGDLVRLVSGKLALCINGGNGSGIVIVQRGGTGLKWISTKDIQARLSSHPEAPRTYETGVYRQKPAPKPQWADIAPVLKHTNLWKVSTPDHSSLLLTSAPAHAGFIGFVYGEHVYAHLQYNNSMNYTEPPVMIPDAVRFRK